MLADLGATPTAVEQAIDRLAARGSTSGGTIGVSGRVKRALDQARREGRRLGHRCPGAEHLLLVLAADEDGIASRVLHELGVTPTRLRDALAARLGPDADELVSRLDPTAGPPSPTPLTMPEAGLEPAIPFGRWFLKPLRIPFRHSGGSRIIVKH